MRSKSSSKKNDGLFSPAISLVREERELTKPKNWGEITFKRLHERFGDLNSHSHSHSNSTQLPSINLTKKSKSKIKSSTLSLSATAPKKSVEEALNNYPVIKAPLDGTNIVNELNENDQCEFFKNYSQCEILKLTNWTYISENVLRTITITMGDSLLELDVSNTNITKTHFEILFSCITSLKSLKLSSCSLIDAQCMKLITQVTSKTLQELYVDHCSQFHIEPLLWISGVVGINSSKLSKLRTLDLSYCPLADAGLSSIGIGMKLIRYLNLEGCDLITDHSLCAVLQSNTKLLVLNISGCYLITSKSIITLANSCPHIISLNLSRCSKITDSAMNSLTQFSHHLQALNLAGLRYLTEGAIFRTIQMTPGILMLNITGCELVTITGLRSLIQGLHYVVEAKTYFGFKPIDEHIEMKLTSQLNMIYDTGVRKISQAYHHMRQRREQKQIMELVKIDKCARIIQNYMTRYMLRVRFYYLWRTRVQFNSTILIQRVFRGYLGRIAASHAEEEKQRLRQLIPHCIRLQKIFRGKRSRRQNPFIHEVIKDLYDRRRREAESAILVRLQAYGRHYLAQKKYLAWKEMIERKREDTHNAAIVIQGLIRKGLSKGKMKKLLMKKQRIDDLKNRSAARIQAFYRASKGKYNSKLTRQELFMIQRRRKAAGDLLGRVIRGYQSRQYVNQLRIQRIVQYCAARTIQKVYRGRRVIHWRDMRLNIIASFVLDRQYIERMERTKFARIRYQQYLQEIQKDSASDSDDEVDINSSLWVKQYNRESESHSWMHIETGEITYEEPPDDMALQKSLILQRIKVLWCVQNEWFEGVVTRYHTRKKRYRIEYDDGDHEWLNIEAERERVQVLTEAGTWVMFSLWKPPLLEHEFYKKDQKAEKDRLRSEAYRDARQWRVITTDQYQYSYDQNQPPPLLPSSSSSSQQPTVMFLSNLTGIIRVGSQNALDWVIQDDGYGFPCFYNTTTGETVYDDPRFESNTTEELEKQRDYIMSELRYAVYFCRDVLDRYDNAVYLKNQQKIHYQYHKILSSNKPKLLTAFLLRAKALYKQISVVDKPIEHNLQEEITYATWLSERISNIVNEAIEYQQKNENEKKEIMKKVIKTEKETTKFDPIQIRV